MWQRPWRGSPVWCGPGPTPWQTTEGECDPWAGSINFGNWQLPLGNFFNLSQMARCGNAGCPQGGVPGGWWAGGWKGTCGFGRGCPWVCRGCQAGWPFDADLRHIGPAKYPNSNRWDCNRVRWLGQAAQAVPWTSGGYAQAFSPFGDKQELYPRWVG
jgi:hypothetical protein